MILSTDGHNHCLHCLEKDYTVDTGWSLPNMWSSTGWQGFAPFWWSLHWPWLCPWIHWHWFSLPHPQREIWKPPITIKRAPDQTIFGSEPISGSKAKETKTNLWPGDHPASVTSTAKYHEAFYKLNQAMVKSLFMHCLSNSMIVHSATRSKTSKSSVPPDRNSFLW